MLWMSKMCIRDRYVLGKRKSNACITGITTGKIIDYGIKDSMNMGDKKGGRPESSPRKAGGDHPAFVCL